MATSVNFLTTATSPLQSSLYKLKGNSEPQIFRIERLSDESIWQNFLANNRILHLFRPDYFMIYKFSTTTILYQQNINLDLGVNDVSLDKIMHYMVPADLDHIMSIDRIMCQMTIERKLQPLDFVYRICANIECPNPAVKRIMRTSFLIHSDATGKPELGFFCFHDVTSMVTSIKPNNYDITFDPGQSHLVLELANRMKSLKPRETDITNRERDILSCIDKGMSSKEIASNLFIAKTTVDTHRQNMLRKWELPNTAALLKRAREEAWI